MKTRQLLVSTLAAVLLSLQIRPTHCKHDWLEAILGRIRRLVDKSKSKDGEPGPTVIQNFLTKDEATSILAQYERLLRSSAHVVDSAVRRDDQRYRTSRSVRLPPLGDDLVLDIERRSATLAGVTHDRCEDFQLACYDEGQLYGLHRDDTDASASASSGGGGGVRSADRAATVLIYLREPDSGGETLFTRRPIEDERDMDTKRPLNTEAGALKLFKSYCDRPRKKFVVVTPKVGAAVTWKNWYGDGDGEKDMDRFFAARSTHGACPVKGAGRKCVIQQWMSKSTEPQPLRDGRVAALFPAGADASYQLHEDADGGSDGTGTSRKLAGVGETPCFFDASARAGSTVSSLCFTGVGRGGSDSRLVQLEDDGPYSGVGSWRIAAGELKASLPLDILEGGLTVSFWVRGMDVGTTLLSIGGEKKSSGVLSASVTGRGEAGPVLEVRAGNETAPLEINDWDFAPLESKWFWMSFSVSPCGKFTVRVWSRKGKGLGSTSVRGGNISETCAAQEEDTDVSKRGLALRFVSREARATKDDEKVAFVQTPSMDMSFLLIHDYMLNAANASSLRQQAKRYDINS